MSSMGKLLLAGVPIEISAEEEAQEKAALQSVQREMDDADEVNLLEEEDMHVFDRQPLTDGLSLVSCNTCKKPIKTSQYAAHAERCRSLSAQDDSIAELDGGAGHNKPPRKAQKKLLPSQDTTGKDSGRMGQAPTNSISHGYEDNCDPTLMEHPRSVGSVDSISELDTRAYSEPVSRTSSRTSPGVDSVCMVTSKESLCTKEEPEAKSHSLEESTGAPIAKKVVKKRRKRSNYYRPRKRR